MTNRKSHTRFRLVPKSSTLDDPEWPWTAKTNSVAEKMRLLEPTAQIWMKIDPYYQRQKCRPMILVSGNITYMWIFQGVPYGGGIKWEWGWRRLQFLAIWVVTCFTSSESSEISQQYYIAICYPLSAGNYCKMNDLEWLFDVKIRFRPALCCRIYACFGAHCTNLNEDRPILSPAKM